MHILCVMETDPQIASLEQMAKDAKLNMSAVLNEAGVAPSTWFRWRHRGVEPKIGTLRRVQTVIEREAARHAA